MSEHFEKFGGDYDAVRSTEPVLPEDEEALQRTVDITRDVFRNPRSVKFDHLYSAIETWENLQDYVSDPHVSDLIGEVIDFLSTVFKGRPLGFQDAQRGKQTVAVLTQFLGISGRRNPYD